MAYEHPIILPYTPHSTRWGRDGKVVQCVSRILAIVVFVAGGPVIGQRSRECPPRITGQRDIELGGDAKFSSSSCVSGLLMERDRLEWIPLQRSIHPIDALHIPMPHRLINGINCWLVLIRSPPASLAPSTDEEGRGRRARRNLFGGDTVDQARPAIRSLSIFHG